MVATLIHSFNPTTVNEFTFGVNRARQTVDPLSREGLSRNIRFNVAPNLPQFFPQASFGGVPNAGVLNIEQRFPFFGTNRTATSAAATSNGSHKKLGRSPVVSSSTPASASLSSSPPLPPAFNSPPLITPGTIPLLPERHRAARWHRSGHRTNRFVRLHWAVRWWRRSLSGHARLQRTHPEPAPIHVAPRIGFSYDVFGNGNSLVSAIDRSRHR